MIAEGVETEYNATGWQKRALVLPRPSFAGPLPIEIFEESYLERKVATPN